MLPHPLKMISRLSASKFPGLNIWKVTAVISVTTHYTSSVGLRIAARVAILPPQRPVKAAVHFASPSIAFSLTPTPVSHTPETHSAVNTSCNGQCVAALSKALDRNAKLHHLRLTGDHLCSPSKSTDLIVRIRSPLNQFLRDSACYGGSSAILARPLFGRDHDLLKLLCFTIRGHTLIPHLSTIVSRCAA